MKICQQCRRTYEDNNLNFCLEDGTALAVSDQAAPTVMMPAPPSTAGQPGAAPTQWQPPIQQVPPPQRKSKTWLWVLLVIVLLLLLCGGGIGGLLLLGLSKTDMNFNVDPSTPRPFATQSASPSETEEKSTSGLTLEKYNRLKTGMPRSEVRSILGGKGNELSSSTGGGYSFAVEQWTGEDFDSIIVTFQNDKLQEKYQIGLDDK